MNEKESKRNDKKDAKKKNIAPRVITAIAAVVAAGGIFTAVCTAALPKDRIVNGVTTEGIDISGMTLGEATDAISESDILKNTTFTVTSGNHTIQINAADIDLTVDVNATAQKAFDICKSKNKIADAFKSLQLKFTTEDVAPVPSLNNEKLDALLYDMGVQINGELSEYTVQINEDNAVITPGSAGQSKDVSAAREKIIKELSEGKTDIKIELVKETPPELNEQSLIEAVHRDAQNAEYVLENGAAVVKPHVIGAEASAEQASAAAKQVNNGAVAQVPITHIMPEITTDALQSKLYTGTLATYSTRYSTSAVNRSKNVELATSRINGTVLLPGDVFSYNGVVGTRTAANGFKNAPVYENGKSVDGIGGGVCQVSTTLYSAVLYADLEVVQRQNHSLTVAYVPLGQDATVVDGAIDFQFKNNTDAPIRIDAYASNGTVKVSLVGTPVAGKSVKITHETLSTKEPTENITNDPNLPEGTKTITSNGKKGYTVRTTKVVYQDGREVSRKSLGNSTYKMVPTEVTMGTGPAPVVAPTMTTETAMAVSPSMTVEPTPAPTTAPEETPAPTAPSETPAPTATPAPSPEAVAE